MIAKSHRWRLTAMAAAALMGLWGTSAMALSLGRITVQSALGEPLRAEIDIPDINVEEAATLKTSIAAPDAFKAAGMEYNAAMPGLRASLQRLPDGRSVIRINGDRAINDPFVDLILVANWSTGRIVRDYTLLFDPPSLRKSAPIAPTQAQIPSSPAVPASPQAQAPAPSRPAPAVVKEPIKSPTKEAPRAQPVKSEKTQAPRQVLVKPGDTAGQIAAAVKPASVSLDQMLVALLRSNPDAFMGDNVNRVKAGAVIDIPNEELAAATTPGEASRMIVAQSKDFNEFRRKLAGSAPVSEVAVPDRQASGSIQTQVEEKKIAQLTPDKLTLSKGAVQGQMADEQLAKDRAAKDAASRAAELEKNISELSKLGVAASSAASEPQQPKPQGAASEAQPVAPSPAPVMAAKPPVVTPPAIIPPESSLIDSLMEDPMLPVGAAALIALLAGFGVYRVRQRKAASHVDSSFMESRLRPDSFFGASGGQSVDTNEGPATGSSMVYSPSQLDSADDVDPVAEADVYLAYGRDLQAEEILKEALRTTPGRVAIHQKLLEIFAKRRDTKRFSDVAATAYKVTGGNGQDWARICEMGLSIDPTNALYQPGGQPANQQNFTAPAPIVMPSAIEPAPAAPHAGSALDLDLDFSIDDEPQANAPTAIPAAVSTPEPVPAATDNSLDFEFEESPVTDASAPQVDFDLDAETSAGNIESLPEVEQTPVLAMDSEKSALDFDLSESAALEDAAPSVDLDLGESPDLDPNATNLDFDISAPASLDAVESVEALQAVGDFDLGATAELDPTAPVFDFELDEPSASVAPQSEPEPVANVDLEPEETSEPEDALDLDFDLDSDPVQPAPATPAPSLADALDFSLPDLDLEESVVITPDPDNEDFKEQAKTSFGATAPAPLAKPAPAPAEPDLGMLQFDLGELSLDSQDSAEPQAQDTTSAEEDPLETKLALAEEFKAIGDDDGARALIEEVIAEASGEMKAKAQRALRDL